MRPLSVPGLAAGRSRAGAGRGPGGAAGRAAGGDAGAGTPRRDPAPSRLAYRLHRLWLTPGFRRFLSSGLPALALVAALAGWLGNSDNIQALREQVYALRDSIAARPEFAIRAMAIDGASAELAQDIREILPIDFPTSSLDIDLEEMRRIVAELDAVARVEMRVRPGGILQVDVVERVPAVVWRDAHALETLDTDGHRVSSLSSRLDRPDLPLIAGPGAEQAVAEALELFEAAAPIRDRLRGLVRVGGRRWDVVLDRDQRILLPETDPVAALQRVIAVDQASELLARDVLVVDMRLPARPTLRLGPLAVEELRQIRAINAQMVSQ